MYVRLNNVLIKQENPVPVKIMYKLAYDEYLMHAQQVSRYQITASMLTICRM